MGCREVGGMGIGGVLRLRSERAQVQRRAETSLMARAIDGLLKSCAASVERLVGQVVRCLYLLYRSYASEDLRGSSV